MTKWEEILRQIQCLYEQNEVIWFRGHSNYNYKLNSGLYRISDDEENVKKWENDIYNAFINLGDCFCSKYEDKKEWYSLFLMQHYGLYTRLLDWTDSFATALYFANLNRNSQKKACIWIINPIKLNSFNGGLYERGIDRNYSNIGLITLDTLPERVKNYTNFFEDDIHIRSFALMPRKSNDRLVSQNGFFTVQGSNICKSLEEEYKEYFNDFIFKIELPPDTYHESINFIKMNGINYYTLFGGVDGLCNYIKTELLNIDLKNI